MMLVGVNWIFDMLSIKAKCKSDCCKKKCRDCININKLLKKMKKSCGKLLKNHLFDAKMNEIHVYRNYLFRN